MIRGPLHAALEVARPVLAVGAQHVLDDWTQDEEGIDEVFGTGGACDAISRAFEDVLGGIQYIDAGGRTASPHWMEGGWPGDEHAWLIAYDDYEAVVVDLPAHVYETGGGYRWRKRPDVHVHPSDIVLEAIPRADVHPEDGDY